MGCTSTVCIGAWSWGEGAVSLSFIYVLFLSSKPIHFLPLPRFLPCIPHPFSQENSNLFFLSPSRPPPPPTSLSQLPTSINPQIFLYIKTPSPATPPPYLPSQHQIQSNYSNSHIHIHKHKPKYSYHILIIYNPINHPKKKI